ncbi:MAG: extracellular solute-binding protein [Clostridia bacterium]|nr:extracellular solute-binding protein [Clostridia bacterium]
MKKMIKLLSLLMALILALSMFAGCKASEEEETDDEEEPITMTIGIPVDSSDENWSDWESVLATWIEDFEMFYKCTLKFTKVPDAEDTKAVKKFMRQVDSGKIACFFTSREDFIEDMMEDETILTIKTVQSRYTAVMEETPQGIYSVSEEKSMENYMYPIYGTFQGLYYNRTMFKELGIENPTSWENLLADIAAIKAKGITPIAAGFADEGLNYFVEELIMSEGGTAEHSYQPSFGVVSSWERAVNDIKTLQGLGAFTADCYNVSFDDALQAFLNGEAAMIVAPSTSFKGALADGTYSINSDDVKVVGFPNTPTGKREEGAFVGRVEHGVYFGKNNFNKKDTRYAECVIELLGDDYFTSGEFYELVADTESTFCVAPAYYSDYLYEATNLDNAKASLVKNATAADWTMSERFYTFDTTVASFRKALTGTDVETALLEATNAEIAAVEAAEAEKKKD